MQDYEEAVKWYRLAADQGDADAQTNLGFMYRDGKGVVQDHEEAVKWYRLAADQGDALAQTILGNMYRDGRGVVQDYVQAHMWYNLAAAHLTGSDRNQAVESRAAVEAKIPPAQVAEAQKMAREWRPKRAVVTTMTTCKENLRPKIILTGGNTNAQTTNVL